MSDILISENAYYNQITFDSSKKTKSAITDSQNVASDVEKEADQARNYQTWLETLFQISWDDTFENKSGGISSIL